MSIKDLELAADFCNTLGSPANELNWDNAPECSKRTWDLVGVFSYTLGITMYGHANDEDKPWHHEDEDMARCLFVLNIEALIRDKIKELRK